MHIKHVNISGFRTYLDLNMPESDYFSPKLNVIIGKNGFGKTNILNAIQFVIGDKYAASRPEDRKQLLHQGGKAVMSGYVEIVFDNSDHRLGEEEEVAIRRTIGLKKDEFRVNGKTHKAEEVRKLLDAAGLSSVNQFNVVEQGRVTSLAKMSPEQLLTEMKNLAGLGLYEERRAESQKLLADAESKTNQIRESIQQMEKRLADLQGEKDELRKYKQLDAEKRAMEYCIYNRQVTAAKSRIDELERKKAEGSGRSEELHKKFTALDRKIREIQYRKKTLEAELAAADRVLERLRARRTEADARRTTLELQANDASSQQVSNDSHREKIEQQLAEVQGQLDRAHGSLPDLQAAEKRAVEAEKAAREEHTKIQKRLDDLLARKGRAAQFRTQAERDDWLRAEIRKNEEDLRATEAKIKDLEREVAHAQEALSRVDSERDRLNAAIQAGEDSLKGLSQQGKELLTRRDAESSKQREAWKKQHEMEQKIRQLKEHADQTERRWEKTIPRDLKLGLDALQKIQDKHGIHGVFGPLISLMSAEEMFHTAIESTASNALLHVVVETDDVASRILDVMNSERLPGRLTFMPLNRLRRERPQLPEANEEVMPLIDNIKFDPAHERAFFEVFGKTLLARQLSTATRYSRQYNLDCITIDGDKVDRKGAMTGGYVETTSSRLPAFQLRTQLRQELGEAEASLREAAAAASGQEQLVTDIVADVRKLREKEDALKREIERNRSERRMKEEELLLQRNLISERERTQRVIEQSKQDTEASIAAFNAELRTDMRSKLSPADDAEVSRLSELIVGVRKAAATTQNGVTEATERLKAAQERTVALQRQRTELQDRLAGLRIGGTGAQASSLKSDLGQITAQIKALDSQLSSLEDSGKKKRKAVDEEERQLADLERQRDEYSKLLQEDKEFLDTYHSQRAVLMAKREQAMKSICNLGTYPAEAIEKFQQLDDKKLLQRRQKVAEETKKYSHVNKKALDQYTQIEKTHTELTSKLEAVLKEREEIKHLLEHLDMQKDEAVALTFRQVKDNFETVFRELTGGHSRARMMIRRTDPDASSQEKEQIDSYAAIDIEVGFGGGTPALLTSLSGGQQSIVALSLVFAIQECDRRPFYLFDEVDAALDPNYAEAVAKKMKDMSDKAQVIAISFKSHLLDLADKHYLISFKNKCSYFKSGTIDAAHKLAAEVQAEAEQEEREPRTSERKRRREAEEED
eukprot:TRINITY_DN4679_c0_g1_i1.p1 TRINITY_DN4679_c0_g1~~TRINITY_DN4679_c0_g1_i1.p1  ORF type:complete len:1212 (+),score=285.66 TRINITY_DN4679_c0_g1_i1:51-3686(+)